MDLNFSRVAYAYDRTRYHPPEVSGKIATAITAPVEKIFRDPHFLEVGVGTGRIAVPIIARGYRFTGVDLSPAMLEVMRYKIAGVARKVRLVEADVRELPFEKGSFHAVISVHVWHQIREWQRALLEVIRILRPGGFLFEGWDECVKDNEDWRIQEKWREILAEMGYTLVRGRHTRRLAEVERALRQLGLEPKTKTIAEWTEERTPRQSLEILSEQLYSFTWEVPEEVFRPSIEALERWMLETYEDLDAPFPIRWRFVLRTTRLP
ncbi:class I SAM-dependent methyltransferase [Marinithermus hydrothermalis]|uniref:Methyltransferase type 11 n=1 Tax=Marinithermus hydrothermalis (strain DSM 14884 / JCM 11576 / T1) TaxID=869210 RepID=F2NN15_MARHT|nr:class I SAM-dependent methyltransferase [Marinithermus hydrothermalis]AEB12754.1 Methyltransferase type 11 [Marinithermus hydrothermalis DSM 14884]